MKKPIYIFTSKMILLHTLHICMVRSHLVRTMYSLFVLFYQSQAWDCNPKKWVHSSHQMTSHHAPKIMIPPFVNDSREMILSGLKRLHHSCSELKGKKRFFLIYSGYLEEIRRLNLKWQKCLKKEFCFVFFFVANGVECFIYFSP